MKNWTIKEAVRVIENGTDAEAIKEIARINPVFAIAVAKHDVVTIADMMGEKFTVRRLDTVGTSEDVEDTDDEAVEAEAPVKATKKAATKKASAPVEVDEDGDLASMSTKQLMALCDKKGIKVPHYGKNKAFYLEKLQGGAEEPADEDAEKDENPYAGLKTTQLFKMCKEQGIKAEMRKPAKYYIDLLEAAKAENAETEAEAEDDWDEEEEAPAKPAKKAPTKKATTKKAKKPAPMPEPEDDDEAEDEDDGDEWDI